MRDRVALLRVVVHVLARRVSARQAGIVLLYHRVAPTAGDPQRELVPALAASAFSGHLRWLRRLYRPVRAATILEAASNRRRWQRFPVAVTFDDDSSLHSRFALPALERAGIGATFFLSGASLDSPQPYWWERLQAAVELEHAAERLVDAHCLHSMAASLQSASAPRRAEAMAALGATPVEPPMAIDDVRTIAARYDVGFHTLHHDPLPTLDDEGLARALEEGRSRLEREVGRPAELLAYPHGAAAQREAVAARRAGFRLSFTTAGVGCHPGDDPMLLGRVEVTSASAADLVRQIQHALHAVH